jgi:nicotinamidase-related amidase
MPTGHGWPLARFGDLPPLANAALLVIDAQRAFVEPASRTFVPGAEPALACAIRLLDAFARCDRPTVATRHAHLVPPAAGGMGSWWASFLLEGSRDAELVPEVAQRAATIVTKRHYSAFRDTALEHQLRSLGTRTVVLAGFMTHICVDTTARDAFQLGFDVVVAHDACASRHAVLHEASLQCLAHAVARLGSAADLSLALERLTPPAVESRAAEGAGEP